jgi:RimJ/RimL family protein N-acetyltransferase
VRDASALSRLLSNDPPEYSSHFAPFARDAESLTRMLAAATRDRYWGIHSGTELAGLVMLRGLDQGFETPAFGVYIAKAFAGRGLGSLALQFTEQWCRENDCRELMLTVHPENAAARRIYERAGFLFAGEHSSLGLRILRKTL